MKLSRGVMAFCLLGIYIFWAILGAQGIEINGPCGDDCELSLKSDVQSLLMGLSVTAFLIAFKARLPERLDDRVVRIWRRCVAFNIDLLVCSLIIFSIEACVIVGWNAAQTGTISWNIELAPSAGVVILILLIILFSVWAIFSYFTWHKKRQLPTVGQYICGFVIVRDDSRPKRYWWYGSLVAHYAICTWPVWIWFSDLRLPRDGTYWWDRDAGTRPKTFF